MHPERIGVEAWAHDESERCLPGTLDGYECTARERFVAFVRAEAHGVIWPSVVVSRERDEDWTRISVRGLAFRAMAGGSNAQQI